MRFDRERIFSYHRFYHRKDQHTDHTQQTTHFVMIDDDDKDKNVYPMNLRGYETFYVTVTKTMMKKYLVVIIK